MNELREQTIIEKVNALRDQLRIDAERIIALKKDDFFKKGNSGDKADVGEMMANIMLSYRAIEDARMRLGKVIQAHEGGESVYDKPENADGSEGSNERSPVDASRNEGETSV